MKPAKEVFILNISLLESLNQSKSNEIIVRLLCIDPHTDTCCNCMSLFNHRYTASMPAAAMAGTGAACTSGCNIPQESGKDFEAPSTLCCHHTVSTSHSGAARHGTRYVKKKAAYVATHKPSTCFEAGSDILPLCSWQNHRQLLPHTAGQRLGSLLASHRNISPVVCGSNIHELYNIMALGISGSEVNLQSCMNPICIILLACQGMKDLER